MALSIEEIKRATADVDVDLLAKTGFESLSETARYHLKTQGVCAQRQVGVFMLRVRVPGGKCTAAQMRRVSALARRFGHGVLHITTRGGLEIHHVKIGDVPEIWRELEEVGLTTKGTCGDTIRNVVGCAHAGTYAAEVLPLEPFVALLHEHIVAISDATNISRKMNVAIACSPTCDDHVATSDIGFVATPAADGGPPGFAVWGAGGLGAAPRLAIPLVAWLPQEDLLPAFTGLVAIGERYGDRTSRAKAKIKMLVEKWGAARFVEVFNVELEAARTREFPALRVAAPAPAGTPPPSPRAGTVVEQKQAGLFTVPALVPMGELTFAHADALADAAEQLGDGIVHLTPDQNAELQFVTAENVDRAVAEIEAVGLRTQGRGGIADVVSCVGIEYCALAVAGSMTMGDEIAHAMEGRRIDPRYEDFRVHVSGCPHSCAKHQVADIGLSGGSQEINDRRREVFTLYLGGNAASRRLGVAFPKKIERTRVVAAIDAVLAVYELLATPGERFSAAFARVGSEPFFAAVRDALDESVKTPTSGKMVVIGNGMAGARFVEDLRKRDADKFSIVMYGDERGGNYNRIMLSGVLGGFRQPDDIVTHAPTWYEEHNVTLRSGNRIAKIDRSRRIVIDQEGHEQPYDVLVMATGSRAFLPKIEGIDRPGVFGFRTLSDCDLIRKHAAGVKKAIVLGGGLLGLEAASGLRALGVEVTVVHLASWLMEQQLDQGAGSALLPQIQALDIEVYTDARATALIGDENGVQGVRLADGRTIEGQLVIVCCGVVANVELAREAGISTERGIIVDDTLRTSDDRIYALGECVQHRGTTYGLVDPLWDQAEVLARRFAGEDATYSGSKTGTRLKVAGINVVSLGERSPAKGDEVVAARGSDGSFRSIITRDGKLVGAQVIGDQEAAAFLAQAFTRDAPLAGDPVSFVLGNRTAMPLPQPAGQSPAEDHRVCVCNDVRQSAIVEAIRGGAHDVAAIGRCTGAGTGCGSCRGELASLVIANGSSHRLEVPNLVDEPSAASAAPPGELKTIVFSQLSADLEAIAYSPAATQLAALNAFSRKVRAAAILLEPLPEVAVRSPRLLSREAAP